MAFSPAVNFHAAIYQRRPDVEAIVHLHSHHVSVLSSTGRTIGMYNVASVLFHEDQATFADDGVRPHLDVVDALGDKRVVLDEEPRRDRRLAVARARHDRGGDARGGGPLPHRVRGDRRHRDRRCRGRRNGRAAYQKYFLPNMWEANLERLRRSDPDLFVGIDG